MPCIDVNAPRQYDGFSCGVYTIKFAELILRELPRTTATVLDERFGSYVQPGSISKEDAKRMRRDMLSTLKDLHILYVERVARQKKERAERREKRLQEKAAAAVAAVQASSSSGVADAKQDAGDQVSLSDDQVSLDTASTSMSVIKPISPVAGQTSKPATASSASGNIRANEKTRVQTSSSQNSDWVSFFEDPKAASTTTVNTTATEGGEEEEDVMPRGRASSRASGIFKSLNTSTKPSTASNTDRKAKKPVESESDESDCQSTNTPPPSAAAAPDLMSSIAAAATTAVDATQNSTGSVTIEQFDSLSDSSSNKKRRTTLDRAADSSSNQRADFKEVKQFFHDTLQDSYSSSGRAATPVAAGNADAMNDDTAQSTGNVMRRRGRAHSSGSSSSTDTAIPNLPNKVASVDIEVVDLASASSSQSASRSNRRKT